MADVCHCRSTCENENGTMYLYHIVFLILYITAQCDVKLGYTSAMMYIQLSILRRDDDIEMK